MSGWIKLHRNIESNWLYTEKRKFSRLEAWLDILITVNYSEAKVFIKGKIYIVKRGESIMSLDSWGKRWNWDKSKVRRFFELLVIEKMIEVKTDNITTHLKVCNYASYQDERHTNETQTTHKRNANEIQTTPIEEEKEYKKEKEGKNKFNFRKELLNLSVSEEYVNDWLEVRKRKKAANTSTALQKFMTEAENANISYNEAVKIAAENSWAGFKAEWLHKQPQQKQLSEPKSKIQSNMEALKGAFDIFDQLT